MTDQPHRPSRNVWLYWGLAGLVLAAVIALIAMALANGKQTSAASDDYLRPGLNKPTADLLALDPMTGEDQVKAPAIDLTNEDGKPLTLSQFHGKVAIVTFNDDRCTDLCALLAQDVIAADNDLTAAERADVAFVSINANPYYPAPADAMAWSRQHGLAALGNWYFGTGSPKQLTTAAAAWGVPIQLDPTNRDVVHGTEIFIVGLNGNEIDLAQFGSGAADTAAFGHGLAQLAVDALPASERGKVSGSGLGVPLKGGTGVGDTPASFSLGALNGRGTLSTASDRGKYTVLNFWASTCAACTTELPDFEREHRELGDQVAFLGIDVSDVSEAARAFAAKHGVGFPLASDPHGTVAGRFRVTGLPYTVILGPSGNVLVRHPGAFSHDELDYVLRELDDALPVLG
jgi:cytochrome oxidase Cu insertion factor (SCO1/SenC/PrrC family)